MATIKNGQAGQFKGKIGEVIISNWNGKTIGRSTPRKTLKPATLKQKDQRSKFKIVSNFLGNYSDQIAIGWASGRRYQTAINQAVSYHLNHALEGHYPDYQIDYKKVLISRGRGMIDGGFRSMATAGKECSVEITWLKSNSTSDITQSTDQLYVVFVDEMKINDKISLQYYNRIAQRGDLITNIFLPYCLIDHPLHVYIFFSSEDGKLASKSEYLGIITPMK